MLAKFSGGSFGGDDKKGSKAKKGNRKNLLASLTPVRGVLKKNSKGTKGLTSEEDEELEFKFLDEDDKTLEEAAAMLDATDSSKKGNLDKQVVQDSSKSLWKIITTRYFKSGIPKLVKEKK